MGSAASRAAATFNVSRPGTRRTITRMDPLVRATLQAYEDEDAAFVERAFHEVLRRSPDDDARTRALAKLGDGTLSRATFVHELVTSAEATRVRELDDAVALGLGARARGERLAWLQAPPGTDERVVEIPWVLSRLVPSGRVLEVGYAFAEAAYLGGLLRAGIDLVGVDLADREVDGMERLVADVACPAASGCERRPGPPRVDARARRRGQHGIRARRRSGAGVTRSTRFASSAACSARPAGCS